MARSTTSVSFRSVPSGARRGDVVARGLHLRTVGGDVDRGETGIPPEKVAV